MPPPDKFTSFNDKGKTTTDILNALAELRSQGYTGPIATKYNASDFSTTYFVGGY
jgi:hypothetical protein